VPEATVPAVGVPTSGGISMESQTIRISKTTHDSLRELASTLETTMAAIVAEAVEEYKKKKFWENYYSGYAALRADPTAWAEYQDEIKLWDVTLSDGLEEWSDE
jgi:predicted DNA-binding protein